MTGTVFCRLSIHLPFPPFIPLPVTIHHPSWFALFLALRVASTILITPYHPALYAGSCGYSISHQSFPLIVLSSPSPQPVAALRRPPVHLLAR